MSSCMKTGVTLLLLALCVPAAAQQGAESMREARESLIRDETIEVDIRLREAEAALAEAAQQVAELSRRNLPRVAMIDRVFMHGDRPVLGISIGVGDSEGPVEGVTIRGVSPGGAAAEAGLRSGDVIIAVNSESLRADNERAANDRLLDFMQGIEKGDKVDVKYLRNGKTETVVVEPREVSGMALRFDGRDFTLPAVPHVAAVPPVARPFNSYIWMSGGNGFGDMELVKLTKRLGDYFGTDEGILIVRAPDNEDLKLQDGDVILAIDSRKPNSVHHATRILGSYQSGETVEIEIMRDKRKRTVSIEIPDNRQSFAVPQAAPAVQAVPNITVVPAPAGEL